MLPTAQSKTKKAPFRPRGCRKALASRRGGGCKDRGPENVAPENFALDFAAVGRPLLVLAAPTGAWLVAVVVAVAVVVVVIAASGSNRRFLMPCSPPLWSEGGSSNVSAVAFCCRRFRCRRRRRLSAGSSSNQEEQSEGTLSANQLSTDEEVQDPALMGFDVQDSEHNNVLSQNSYGRHDCIRGHTKNDTYFRYISKHEKT